MRKYKVLRHCHFIPFLFCMCFYACIRNEGEGIKENGKYARFFNTPNTDMRLYSIAAQLKLKNDTTEFVSDFIEKYGYPVWDKAFRFPEKENMVYAVPIMNDIPNSEIEAIWFFIVKYGHTTYTLYSRAMANEIIELLGGDGIEETWMLDKIMKDCMGKALYNGLKESLKGKTLVIQFNETQDGSFGSQGEGIGISLGMQMESNQLFHEMMHAYRTFQETLSSYNGSTLNGEIEAWYAQYLYTSRLPEYVGSKWEKGIK